jgi:hypothetical protein
MRLSMIIMILAVLVLGISPDTLAGSNGHNKTGFIGITNAVADGNTGFLGMSGLCQAEFPGSHFCTTQEIMESPSLPDVASPSWVHPVYSAVVDIQEQGEVLVDVSGVFDNPGGLSCEGWNNNSGAPGVTGMIQTGMSFARTNCNTQNPVSCCRDQRDKRSR